MHALKRTNAQNQDFLKLITELDRELAVIDGEEHAFFSQFNTVGDIQHVVLAYQGGEAIGCGAIKEYSAGKMEVKRMFVARGQRGRGIASSILKELENWAQELSYTSCVLETGIRQPDAIQLYKKNQYIQTPNYPPYEAVQSSVCFEKSLPG